MLQTIEARPLTAVLERARNAGAVLDEKRIAIAVETAVEAYRDQKHWSGETVLEHVSGVLETLLPFKPDTDAIIACLLHHLLYLKEWNLFLLEEKFGTKVRKLIGGIHIMSHVTGEGRRIAIDDLRLLLLTVSDDVRTVLVSLCDRAYLLTRMEFMPQEEKKQLCRDALQLFAPVAARLGIYSLKHRLESLSFPELYPNDAERIMEQVEQEHQQHGHFIDHVAARLQQYLMDQGIHASVVAREKQIFSIFTKMKQKSRTSIHDIHDFYALRVIVDSVEECYRALGFIHRVGRPHGHRFKDYIAFPKPNGYQSLHTTLAQLEGVPEGVGVEVQVRTKEMQQEAELGIAAHWSYKEYGSTERAAESAQLHKVLSSQALIEHDDGHQQLADHIYVLTPKGDLVELPEDATPLDFAFYVHTNLGLSFRGAKVNGAMVPVDYRLENGDIVEILKHRVPQPSPQWMQLLKLSSARSRLKRYLYAQERPLYIAQGRKMVNELFARLHLKPLDQDLTALRECDGNKLTLLEREDLLMKIGQGTERASSLLDRLEFLQGLVPKEAPQVVTEMPVKLHEHHEVHLEHDLRMPWRFAKCCKPIEAANIIGVVNTRAGIVVVHSKGCRMMRNANKEKLIQASWQ